MERKQGCQLGKLPAMAPLATPYVPYQTDNPERYEARQGLIRGTLYPGLDLPFMGMVNKKPLPVTPKSELRAIAFAVQELALYLDTHRDDEDALTLYQKYQKIYNAKKEEYLTRCGPLSHRNETSGEEYEWLKDPWPWEYSANREG